MFKLPLRGERCVLRLGRPSDEPLIRPWLEPGHNWAKTDGPYYPFFTTEQADEFAHELSHPGDVELSDVEPGTPPSLAIIADPETDALLGYVIWCWESEETQWPRMGIVLFPDEVRGHGIGREAIALWTSYLLGNTDWPRLDLATWSGNIGMSRAALAAGYREEARFRDARIVDGVRYHGLVYGITRADWEARSATTSDDDRLRVSLVNPAGLRPNDLLALYESVGWTAYLRDPESLQRALANSHRVAVAMDGGRLVGTARTISDGESIIYLQDVLVHPDYQRRGLGRDLIAALFDSYEGFVGQRVLLTDAEPQQRAFYEALGLQEVHDVNPPLRAFWQMVLPAA